MRLVSAKSRIRAQILQVLQLMRPVMRSVKSSAEFYYRLHSMYMGINLLLRSEECDPVVFPVLDKIEEELRAQHGRIHHNTTRVDGVTVQALGH